MAEWVVFRLSALGDVALMTGVLLHAHSEAGHTFTVITREQLAPLFANHPAVSRVETLPRQLSPARTLARFRDLARQYKGQTLLDWHDTLRSRLLALFWQGPVVRYAKEGLTRRLFFRCRHSGTPLTSLTGGTPLTSLTGGLSAQLTARLTTRLAARLNRFSVPQRYAATLGSIPPAAALTPRLFLTDAEREAARARLAEFDSLARPDDLAALPAADSAPRPLVALHPYATHRNKAWPGNLWLRLMVLLHKQGLPFFLVGQPAPGQEPLPLPPFPVADLTGQTSLRETCALLAEAAVLVSGDSGPLHLACGVGTPVIALFGPTTCHWGFFPQGPRDRVLQTPYACRPCSLHGQGHCPHQQRCLRDLEPELVLERVREVGAAAPNPARGA